MSRLREAGGELPVTELVEQVGQHGHYHEWALERSEKTGLGRWHSLLIWSSIGYAKFGFIVKKNGVWFLTPEGEEALKLGELELYRRVNREYREWKLSRQIAGPEEDGLQTSEAASISEIHLDEIQRLAREGIESTIRSFNPYEFQELCAALLRGMGYHTPHVSPPGKDGGLDIVAYRDPLGSESPRMRVQIKHRQSPASVDEIRQLLELLQKEGDVGIFISSGGFTSDARGTARSAHVHVELIDLTRLIDMWVSFYPKLSDVDKGLLRLMPVSFVAPDSQ
jgi:restriction system protein